MKQLKKPVKIILIVGAILIFLGCIGMVSYNLMLQPVGDDDSEVLFTIKSGTSKRAIVGELADAKLVKNEYATLAYLKLHNNLVLQAGTYSLNRNMSVKEIFNTFNNGNVVGATFKLTFKEGLRVEDYVRTITDATGMDYQDELEKVNNKKFINELIDSQKYWFLTDDVLNDNIYYALEGYLFPDTYEFYKNTKIEEMIALMLNNTLEKLNPYKGEIVNNQLSVHEILTLASLVESEAKSSSDRAMVAGVFMNRINYGWTLGSDVTTYYAVGKKFGETLTVADLANCDNKYNTSSYCKDNVGLSVGPISNPSLSSIEAAIKPTASNYMYFVADCSGKTYFNVNDAGHQQTINKLKSENNWCV